MMIQEYVTKLATTVPPSSPPRDKATDSNPLWPKTIKVVAGSEEMFVSPRRTDRWTNGRTDFRVLRTSLPPLVFR